MMKAIYIFVWILLFVSGCEDEGREGSALSKNPPIEMSIKGRIYSNDPDASIYEDFYGDASIDSVISDMENGDPYATFLLGYLYFANFPSYGVEQDFKKSRELLERAWKMGVIDSGYALGYIYGEGLGVKKNTDIALKYLEESAKKNGSSSSGVEFTPGVGRR